MTTSSTRDLLQISVIVPVFNDPDGLLRCLHALDHQTMQRDRFEVIVVDNGSRTPAGPLASLFGFARCIVERKPGSYAARNTGVKYSQGALLAFTDADCQPHPDWLEKATRAFELDPNVSAIGGRVSLSVSRDRNPAELYELVLSPLPQDKFVELLNFAATANLIVRREVFYSIGIFNEELFSSADREWGNRLVSAGHRLRYSHEIAVAHPARTTIRSLINRRRRIEGGIAALGAIEGDGGPPASRRRLHPSRTQLAVALLIHPDRLGLSHKEGLKVLGLAALLVIVRILEGVRLRLGGKPVR